MISNADLGQADITAFIVPNYEIAQADSSGSNSLGGMAGLSS